MLFAWFSLSLLAFSHATVANRVPQVASAFPFHRQLQQDDNSIFIAGLFNIDSFDWMEIFNFTMFLLNERDNGWYDEIFAGENQNLTLGWAMADSGCDETKALQSYWETRTAALQGGGIHGIMGTRCSGATITVNRLATLEGISQVSPAATSPRLDSETEFPYFSRVIFPPIVEALVSTLRSFQWDRVSVIGSDTQYAKDLTTQFSNLWLGTHNDDSGAWAGEIPYFGSVVLNDDETNSVNMDSAKQVLKNVPTDDPTVNSRVIVLLAHDNHAFPILQAAKNMGFQEDTIWIGLPAWAGRLPNDDTWIPPVSGYFGISQYRNRDSVYQDFLKRLKDYQAQEGLPVTRGDLPDYTAEYIVDATVCLVLALASLPVGQRRDPAIVTDRLRKLQFDGVSGFVSFEANGNRANPRFSLVNLQEDSVTGDKKWVDVGSTSTGFGSTIFRLQDSCFAGFGCALESVPSDKYPVPKEGPPGWLIALVAVLSVLLLAVAWRNWRTNSKKKAYKAKMRLMAKQMEAQMQGMYEVKLDLPVQSPIAYAEKVQGDEKEKSHSLAVWYWEEDEHVLKEHFESFILSGTNFVAFSREVCGQLEHAFQLFKENTGYSELRIDLTGKVASSKTGKKINNPKTGHHYEINFATNLQRNTSSSFTRKVLRKEAPFLSQDSNAVSLPELPTDINFEGEERDELLPVFKGQVIQVTKRHPSNEWMYGTVLYDPLLDDAMKQSEVTGSDGLNAVLSNALHDRAAAGWFPSAVVETADTDSMTTLLQNLGGKGAAVLEPPKAWEKTRQGRVKVPKGSAEYKEVTTFFLDAMYSQRKGVEVTQVERVQNIPLWQSYALKTESLRTRDAENPHHLVHNKASTEQQWLFHGTGPDIVEKIQTQGFNRSFAGQHAVAYGKGVYFARDASYSSSPVYSKPDSDGVQRMFLCRVAVGDWCQGRNNQITPEPKPHSPLELFDSTVDNVSKPSIFVVYHDAQAYPEYLVSFKQDLTHWV